MSPALVKVSLFFLTFDESFKSDTEAMCQSKKEGKDEKKNRAKLWERRKRAKNHVLKNS